MKYLLLVVFAAGILLGGPTLYAQHSMGVTGLLNIPTADMQADGTFMVGGELPAGPDAA